MKHLTVEEQIKKIKSKSFGKRFEDACLSNVTISLGNAKKYERIQEWIKRPKNFLVILGSVGCGKTYLCSAMLDYFLNIHISGARGFSENDLIKEIKNSEGINYSERIEYLINSYILILDDLGAIHSTDWRKEVAFDIIDKRYKEVLPTVITTNIFPNDIEQYYGKRVADRMLSGDNTIIVLNNVNSRR